MRQTAFHRGLPLILLAVGGTGFLTTFVQGRLELNERGAKKSSIHQFDLDEEHRRSLAALAQAKIDFNKRIPRPSDESKD
jgi:hypothetical protein